MTTAAQAADRLQDTIAEALSLFEDADEAQTTRRPGDGGWSARQMLGHLIDSACNNHRRFVLGQAGPVERWDGYVQDDWVRVQRYENVAWRDLVTLWAAYNRHLAHVMSSVSDEAAARSALSPSGDRPITLAFLMDDYLRHLRHHLEALRGLLAPAS